MGQDDETLNVTYQYLLMSIPGIFAYNQYETVRRFLQNMQVFSITMYIQIITALLHFVWSYLFIAKMRLGVFGVALSVGVTNWLNLILIYSYLNIFKGTIHRDAWHFINRDTFKNWREYFKYALPSMLGDVMDWWSYIGLSIFAGQLSEVGFGASLIFDNLLTLIDPISEGIGFTTCCFVGNCIGESRIKLAQRYTQVSLMLI